MEQLASGLRFGCTAQGLWSHGKGCVLLTRASWTVSTSKRKGTRPTVQDISLTLHGMKGTVTARGGTPFTQG